MKKIFEGNDISRKDFIKTAAGLVTAALIRPGSRSLFAKVPEQKVLGSTGIKVTPIGFGASRVNEPGLVRFALDHNVNFLDTGRGYRDGLNEEMLGKLLKGFRKQAVIQSKLKMRVTDEIIVSSGADKLITSQMERSLSESLKALQTDYVDIMLLHGINSKKLLFHEAVLKFFSDAKARGQIIASGFSVHNNNMEVTEAAAENPTLDVIMIPYNHQGSFVHSITGQYSEWNQPKLESLLKTLHEKGVGVIAMKTCSAGTYAFSENEKPSYRQAVQWVLNKDYIDSTAVAMVNYEQIRENLE